MLTYRDTEVRVIDRDTVAIEGKGVAEEVRCEWDANGASIELESLQQLKSTFDANWSDDQIGDLAYHAANLLNEQYTKGYEIAVPDGDGWHILESIRVADDAAANAYAEQNHADQEWYVLNANGDNING